jgi:very-short-patch-repair endonuclease
MTPAERKMWYGLFCKFPYRVLRQRPIDNFIVDFYCPVLSLVVEIDGGGHYTDDGMEYDEKRSEILRSYGLQVERFSNRDVLDNFEGVCWKINEYLLLLNQGETPR